MTSSSPLCWSIRGGRAETGSVPGPGHQSQAHPSTNEGLHRRATLREAGLVGWGRAGLQKDAGCCGGQGRPWKKGLEAAS